MSSPTSANSPTSTSSSTNAGTAGLLYVATSTKDLSLPPNILHDWYDEHTDIVLNCPGNGNLFLRYSNVDKSIGPYEDAGPNFARRFQPTSDDSDPHAEIASARWPYLALVKLTDLEWLKSPQFDAMPRTSALLPPAPDGGHGSGFDAFHAALRSYRTLSGGVPDDNKSGKKRPRWIVGLQTVDADRETFDALDEVFAAKEIKEFRSSMKYELVEGYLEFQEPGKLPMGLVLYMYDGDKVPVADGTVKKGMDKIVRRDDWEFLKEAGDLSLEL